ncbi:MAG: dephospho-CoA kinase [Actinomycetota bacterium]
MTSPGGTKRVIGLTGGIGVGKTTAAAVLADLGAVVVDCDALGRLVAEPGGRAHDGIVERFGPTIVGDDGALDRAALGAIVFNDADALADLNGLTHPAIDAEIDDRIAAAGPDAVVVLDMAVLVETDLGRGRYTEVLVIEAPLDQRLQRLATTRAMSRDDAMARINSQATDDQRRAVADAVIVNDGSHEQLSLRLRSWWEADDPSAAGRTP